MRVDITSHDAHHVEVSLPYASIEKIEAERITCPAEDEGAEEHYRTIRITTTTGEVLELSLEGNNEDNLGVQEVSELPPVLKPEESKDKPLDWLTPKNKGK